MSGIKWIKLSVNMFDDEKIKLIRTMPEGDKIIVIWVQLLCMAGKTNDGGAVYMGQNLYYTEEMLATICNQPLNIMRLAIQTLSRFEMIEQEIDGKIEIVNWDKHQNIDGMEKIRVDNASRQQLHYYRKKLRELGVDVNDKDFPRDLDDVKEYYQNLTSVLTLPHALEEEENKKKNREEKDKDIVEQNSTIPYSDIINHLNEKAGTRYKSTTKKTQSLIKARFNEGFTLEDFKTVIDKKTIEWKYDSKMSAYLRPETLFGTKFESYLNQTVKGKPKIERQAPTDKVDAPDLDKQKEELQKVLEKWKGDN